jgi:hypothetical protein
VGRQYHARPYDTPSIRLSARMSVARLLVVESAACKIREREPPATAEEVWAAFPGEEAATEALAMATMTAVLAEMDKSPMSLRLAKLAMTWE